MFDRTAHIELSLTINVSVRLCYDSVEVTGASI
jgi:hypothetical protein